MDTRLLLARPAALGTAAALLVSLLAGAGLWLHYRPVVEVATSARGCGAAPDHVASLFSDDETTLIRLGGQDAGEPRVLRVEPASVLPGMFSSLLALSADSRLLAYVTASSEMMDDAHIWYVDVGRPGDRRALADVKSGLTPVRPAWSPDGGQLAYVVGQSSTSRPASTLRPTR